MSELLKKLRIGFVKKLIELNEQLIFDKKLLQLYKSKFHGKLNFVIDIGANTGQSIDLFLKVNPNCKIIAFEPNYKLYQQLTLKYSGNPNVLPMQLGISDTVGERMFHESIIDTTSTFEDLDFTSKYLQIKSKVLGVKPTEIIKASYAVKVTTLFDFINTQCTDPIDVLKIDTEGHEYYCLVGLFKGPLHCEIKYIQLEIHKDDMYLSANLSKRISDILSRNGYQVEANIKHGFGQFEDVLFRKTGNYKLI